MPVIPQLIRMKFSLMLLILLLFTFSSCFDEKEEEQNPAATVEESSTENTDSAVTEVSDIPKSLSEEVSILLTVIEELDLNSEEKLNSLSSIIEELNSSEIQESIAALETEQEKSPDAITILSSLSMLYQRAEMQQREYSVIQNIEEQEYNGITIPSTLAYIYGRADQLRQDLGVYEIMREIEDLAEKEKYESALKLLEENSVLLPIRWRVEWIEKLNEWIALRDAATLKLTCRWNGQLLINGKDQMAVDSTSPMTIYPLAPGNYTLKMTYPNGKQEVKEVTLSVKGEEEIEFLLVAPVIENFILVNGGSFEMGSPEDETNRFSNESQHNVTLTRDFVIMSTEVTQSVWEQVMGENPSDHDKGIGADYPVNQINWYEAVEFCNTLSRIEGYTPAYSGSGDNIICDFDADGYRLPTEAEWEYAARGGHLISDYEIYAGSNDAGSVAWYDSNSRGENHPVGNKDPNKLGLYDMSGNVWEWCWDWYDDYQDETRNLIGPESGSARVIRGGSTDNSAAYSRSAFRYLNSPAPRNNVLGLRLVRSSLQ